MALTLKKRSAKTNSKAHGKVVKNNNMIMIQYYALPAYMTKAHQQ
jgi:hypothetical protein